MRNGMLIFEIASILGLFLPMAFAQEKVYSCSRLSREPVMDGDIKNDPAWANVARESDFVRIDTPGTIPKMTWFRVGYTPEAVYFAIECQMSEIAKRTSSLTDDEIWNKDSVEVFLMPKGARDYFHFIVSSEGKIFNALNAENTSRCALWDWQAPFSQGEGGLFHRNTNSICHSEQHSRKK